jgi:hypothetical protein
LALIKQAVPKPNLLFVRGNCSAIFYARREDVFTRPRPKADIDGMSDRPGAFQSHRMCSRLIIGKDEMDAMMIGAPFGLGVLIALGILLAVMNHLSQ